MGTTIINIVEKRGVLEHVMLSKQIELLLSMLEDPTLPADQPPPEPANGILTGNVTVVGDFGKSPLPGFDFALALPTEPIQSTPYKLKFNPPLNPTGFEFWLVLSAQGQVKFVFDFVRGAPGLSLTGARKILTDGVVTLMPLPDKPALVSTSTEPGAQLGPALLIRATPDAPADIRFTPDTDSTAGIVRLGLRPSTIMFGNSGIGFDLGELVLDDSADAAAPGQGIPDIVPPITEIAADQPPWRGLLARRLEFYLPPSVPLFGGTPIVGYLALPTGHGSADLVITSEVPERPAAENRPARPGYSVRIECLDPTAEGLSGLVPTLISASMTLPLDGTTVQNGGPLTFAAGKPVRLTLTITRNPASVPGGFKIGLSVSAQGDDGIVSVASGNNAGLGDPAKIFNLAAAFATSLIAASEAPAQDDGRVVLATLAAAGMALSSLFEPESRFVLHGVTLESRGHGLPVGDALSLSLDYTVTARVTKLEIPGGAMSVQMNPHRPLRIRIRRVTMHVDLHKSGLEMFDLDYSRAEMEVEDPGAWNLQGLENLFDVLGSRSGRGSLWVEVDLRFKLNLGPISVSGVTLRASLVNGALALTVSTMEVGLNMPGVISGRGRMQLVRDGFDVLLAASVVPLNVTADARLIYQPPMIVLSLGADLPAPIPLANSGFGLFGLGGMVGFAAAPNYAAHLPAGQTPESDPVLKQLQWTPRDIDSFVSEPAQTTFGLEAVVGTLPDMGHAFSAKAGLTITAPDVAVRAGLNGRVLASRVRMPDPSYPPTKGVSFVGFLGVNAQAVSFAVLGSVDLLPLLEVRVPISGHFPITGDTSNWYLYLGADGAPHEGRQIGAIAARVLPDILNAGADAYLMLRGNGITGWPHGRANVPAATYSGFVVAFGFGLQTTFGAAPVAWAELYASLDLLIGTRPPTLGGFGRAGGSLHLGPFSVGVDALVKFRAQKQNGKLKKYFWAQVTGRIDLLFDELEETITIAFGDEEPKLELPDPDRHPLDRLDQNGLRIGTLGALIDDSYRVITHEKIDAQTGEVRLTPALLVEDPQAITPEMHVWPDAYLSLPFAILPEVADSATTHFPGVKHNLQAAEVGSQMLRYTWQLTRLELFDVTDEPNPSVGGTPRAGKLAARWQAPRSAPGGDVSELVLFSASDTLWVNRLADNGAGLPHNPLKAAADLCQWKPHPQPGWALGFPAVPQRNGIHLPTDVVSGDPLVSQVTAQLTHAGLTRTGVEWPLDARTTLPSPFTLEEAAIVSWQPPQKIEREFDGYLVAPGLVLPDAALETATFSRQRLRVTLSEPIVNGMLLLVADHGRLGEEMLVLDDRQRRWHIAAVHDDPPNDAPNRRLVLLAAPDFDADLLTGPPPPAVRWLTIDMPFNVRLGIGGIGGVTLTALDAAQAARQALDLQTIWQTEAALAGPKTDPQTDTPAQRAILDPGRLYRIDIDMRWFGTLSDQDEAGQSKVISTRDGATQRQLFFRTAMHTNPPLEPETLSAAIVTRLHAKFEPQLLQRYLAGYEPAQSEQFRFCNDPLRAHFTQDHVVALAKAYGYALGVAIRRTDKAEPDPPGPYPPTWTFATNPAFLTPADRVRYDFALASPCPQPTPGATASISLPLAPEAWYEIYIQASPEDDLWYAPGRLPGVTFRTSRWRTPQQMFAGLGWTVTPDAGEESVTIGDLAVEASPAVAALPAATSDQAFISALAALGANDWPVADTPRLSRLWSAKDDHWRFAGLLVESPEPIIRPGRVSVDGLALEGMDVPFTLHRDRAAMRLLFVATQPVELPDAARLVLACKDGAAPFSAVMALPAAPDFAEDVT